MRSTLYDTARVVLPSLYPIPINCISISIQNVRFAKTTVVRFRSRFQTPRSLTVATRLLDADALTPHP